MNCIRIGSVRGMIFEFVNDLSRPERKGAYVDVRQKCFNFVGRLPVDCSIFFASALLMSNGPLPIRRNIRSKKDDYDKHIFARESYSSRLFSTIFSYALESV